MLGGWQANALFTLQSGTPFTILNGADPAGVLQGIDALVGNAIRPNLNTNLDRAIAMIAKAQWDNGYLHTPVVIGANNGDTNAVPFKNRNNF